MSDPQIDVCNEIIAIMQTYDEQCEKNGYPDTPGGLEHMGDVWSLLSGWRDALKTAPALRTPAPVDAEKLTDLILEHSFLYPDEAKPLADALLAANIFAVPSSQPTWQPIDSAEHNGTEIIYWNTTSSTKGEGFVSSCVWRDADEGIQGGWWDDSITEIAEPEYWLMPLPSPPTSPGSVK